MREPDAKRPPPPPNEKAAPLAAAGESAPAAGEAAALRHEVEELRDKNLRLLAELQNQQKRTQREKHEAIRFAEGEFARELLVVLDDLDRTLQAARSGADAQALAEGIRIIYEHFHKVMESRNITPIEAAGRPFDPAFHEALLQQPSDTQPAGTVIEEAARGYKMYERVLRPSRVVVSSGPPDKAAADGQTPKPPREE